MLLQAIGIGLKVFGAIQQGKAVKAQQAAIARQYEEEAAMAKLQALQAHNDRLEAFGLFKKQTEAIRAINRRSYDDRSLKALVAASQDKSREELSRMSLQSLYQIGKSKYAANQAIYTGKMAMQSAYINAASSLATGIYQMQDVTPSSTTET